MYEILKEKNLKLTDQRKIVFDLIKRLENNATASNIVSACANEVDYSTVYRIINMFLEKGIIEKKLNYADEIIYAFKEEHGHYFTCVKCHNKEKLMECPLDSVDQHLEQQKGYKIISHTVEVHGICKKCLDK